MSRASLWSCYRIAVFQTLWKNHLSWVPAFPFLFPTVLCFCLSILMLWTSLLIAISWICWVRGQFTIRHSLRYASWTFFVPSEIRTSCLFCALSFACWKIGLKSLVSLRSHTRWVVLNPGDRQGRPRRSPELDLGEYSRAIGKIWKRIVYSLHVQDLSVTGPVLLVSKLCENTHQKASPSSSKCVLTEGKNSALDSWHQDRKILLRKRLADRPTAI